MNPTSHTQVTFTGRFTAFREKHRGHISATIAVLAALTFIAAEVVPAVQSFVKTSGVIQYVTLLVVLDLAVSVYFRQGVPVTWLARNQDESMPRLLEAVPYCKTAGVELIEYAGATTLPLIRAIQRDCIPMRMLVKHPDTVEGIQRQRMIATLDTIFNSIFENDHENIEIRCYRLPFTVRGRRLGSEILELGWLTPDLKRKMAFGHANPSVIADLSAKNCQHLRLFFDRTFNDLWNSDDTEEGLTVLARVQSG